MLRQIGVPLATVKELLASTQPRSPNESTAFWREADAAARRPPALVAALIDRLTGRSLIMYEVATRELPARSLLCLKRNIDETGAWALGKEFIGIIRDRALPRLKGRDNAMFSIFWGEVSADSDGPMEWCKPVPDAEAEALAEQFPELTLRTEPAHREACVDLAAGPEGLTRPGVSLAAEALRTWAEAQGITTSSLAEARGSGCADHLPRRAGHSNERPRTATSRCRSPSVRGS